MGIRKPLIPTPPSPETLSHFTSTPWTTPFFTSTTITPITNPSRTIHPNSTRDSFCSSTLSTRSTIPAQQNFYSHPTPEYPLGQIISLVKLGTGLNGYENIMHGGFVGVLLDEVIGVACGYQRETGIPTLTAYLNVEYKKPVRTPGVVLCRGWLEKVEGRKTWGRGTVEDGNGDVLATGEALFVVVREKL